MTWIVVCLNCGRIVAEDPRPSIARAERNFHAAMYPRHNLELREEEIIR